MRRFKKESYSFRVILYLQFLTLTLFCAAVCSWLVYYAISASEDKAYEKIKNNFQANNTNLTENIANVGNYLSEIYNYSTDIPVISKNSRVSDTVNSVARLSRLFQGTFPGFSGPDGMFIYFPTSDYFVSATQNQNDALIVDGIKKEIRQYVKSNTMDQLTNTRWRVIQQQNKLCLVHLEKRIDIYVGMFVRLDTLFYQIAKTYTGNCYYMLNTPDGQTVYKDGIFSELNMANVTELTDHPVTCNGKKYMLTTITIFNGDHLWILAPPDLEVINMKPVFLLIAILLLAMILIVGTMAFLMSRLILKPLKIVEETSLRLQNSSSCFELNFPKLSCTELNQTMNAFERLHLDVTDLQQKIFQEKIERAKLELSKLKSQIAPHFLINCLYVLQNIANSGYQNGEVFDTMIHTLSEHLRYSLSDREHVALDEELYYVENYIRLTQIRFPFSLSYSIEASDAVRQATVFPLILLMLTENTIKFNMIMGEKLHIDIHAEIITKNHREWVRLLHHDSGEGFSPSVLDILNNRAALSKLSEGQHVGLYNIIKRLEYFYPEASIRFYNNDGAAIAIEMPYNCHQFSPEN